MDKLAYELGVLQALKIAGIVGLTKEALSAQTAKRVVAGGRKLVSSGQIAKVPKLLEPARAIPESFDVARAARRASATASTRARTSRIMPTSGPGAASHAELINKQLANLEGRISSARKLQSSKKWRGMDARAQVQHQADIQKLEQQHAQWTQRYNTAQDSYAQGLKQTRPGYEGASPHVTGAYAPAPTQAAPITAPGTVAAPAEAAAAAPKGGRGMGLGMTALGVGGAAAGAYVVNRAGAAGSKVYRAPVPQMYGETVLEMP